MIIIKYLSDERILEIADEYFEKRSRRQHVLLSNKEQLLIAERKALDEYQKHLLDLAILKRDAQ